MSDNFYVVYQDGTVQGYASRDIINAADGVGELPFAVKLGAADRARHGRDHVLRRRYRVFR